MGNFFRWTEVGRYQVTEKSFPNNHQISIFPQHLKNFSTHLCISMPQISLRTRQ